MSTSAEEHAANSQARLAAYRELFGVEPTGCFTFADLDFPIEVLIFSLEIKGKPFVAAVTSGMSDRRMVDEENEEEWSRRELIQYLPQCDEAHARRLRDMAWLPLFDGFFLDSHHSIPWPDAAVEGTPWKNAFFLEPLLKSHRKFRFTIADDEASFLWHIPISDEEYAYKKENGSNALLARLDEVNLPWIFDENNRPPLVVSTEKKANAIKSLKTDTINGPDGPLSAVMVGIDVPDPGELDAFMLLVAEKFKAQRMISPVETAGLLVSIIGELSAEEFARRWNELAISDGILAFFMKQMRFAEVVRITPAGEKLESVSLLAAFDV